MATQSGTIGNAARVLVPRLLPGVAVTAQPDGRLRIGGEGASTTLAPLPAGLTAAIAGLPNNTRSLEDLTEAVAHTDGSALLGMLFAHLVRLSSQGLLTHHLMADGTELATIEPTGVTYRVTGLPVAPHATVRLSRFAVMRRDDDHLLIESGLSAAGLRVHASRLLALMGPLVAGTTAAELAGIGAPLGLDADTVAGWVALLRDGAFLEGDAEHTDDVALWHPRDLLFHFSSRFGRMGGDYGGTFRHIGEMAPAPALRPLPDGPRVPLPVPALEDMLRDDPPFQAVVESRRSIYDHDAAPITPDEIGELLYRVARVRWLGTMPVTSSITGRSGEMEISSRPVPAGGRGYELEFWLTIDRCEGARPGMYHYDPAGHALTLVRPADALTERMLRYAGIASPGVRPQVLITLAARFRRMTWKYDRLAYAATLKHVGVTMQQLYLAATAMGLAPSAQGSGNADLFAEASGTDPLVEGSVGEFILGSAPGGRRSPRPAMLQPTDPSPALGTDAGPAS